MTDIELGNPYDNHITPVVDLVTLEFGAVHGEELVRNYAKRLLWINTSGEGVHPEDREALLRQIAFSANCATQFMVDEPTAPNGVVDLIDEESRNGLLNDERLTATLMQHFIELWPDGRATTVS